MVEQKGSITTVKSGQDTPDIKSMETKSNVELLKAIDDMLAQPAEEINMDFVYACLDILQERAPVMEDYDPQAVWEAFRDKHSLLLDMDKNERLQKVPDVEVPASIDEKCMRAIHHHFRRGRIRRVGQFAVKAMGKVVMLVGVISVLFLGAFAASENVRSRTLNLIIETFGESTDFFYIHSQKEPAPLIFAGWMPEGFRLEDEGTNEIRSWFYCQGESQAYIQGTYYFGEEQMLSIDTEDAEVSNIQIHGMDATVASKGEEIQIAWGTKDKSGFIWLVGYGVALDDLIRVAEQLYY